MERLNNLPKVTHLIVIVEPGFVSRTFGPRVCALDPHRMESVCYRGSSVLKNLINNLSH